MVPFIQRHQKDLFHKVHHQQPHGIRVATNIVSGNMSQKIRGYCSTPTLNPEDITRILRSNESTKTVDEYLALYCAVQYYESNELASNKLMEDARAEARCGDRLFYGIFDGHEGNKCAHTVASRLFYYISAGLRCPDNLIPYKNGSDTHRSLLEFLNDDPHQYYDDDMSNDTLRLLDKPYAPCVDISGSVAIVACIQKSDLYVAGAGDCEAVLGTFSEADGWLAKKMSNNHNGRKDNHKEELKRISSEHPSESYNDLFESARLLGGIAPFRAFGDYFYKWDKETVFRVYEHHCCMLFDVYKTPPYLTARPDVFYHKLTADDKFLILASDGLWDEITLFQAVWLVGEHMRRKNGQSPAKLPPLMEIPLKEVKEEYDEDYEEKYAKKKHKIQEENEEIEYLEEMLKAFNKETLDENAATHLMRYAIGCSNHDGRKYSIDRLGESLSAERGFSCWYRDDITITVIYTDTNAMENPSS